MNPAELFLKRLDRLEVEGSVDQAKRECQHFINSLHALHFVLSGAQYGAAVHSSSTPAVVTATTASSALTYMFGGVSTEIGKMSASPSTAMNIAAGTLAVGQAVYTVGLAALSSVMYALNQANLADNEEYNFENFYNQVTNTLALSGALAVSSTGLTVVNNILRQAEAKMLELDRAEIRRVLREQARIAKEQDDARQQAEIAAAERMNRLVAKLSNSLDADSFQAFESAFQDIITLEVAIDPVIASNGRLYGRNSITTWLAAHNTAPEDRAPLDKNLRSAKAVALLMDELEDNPNFDIATSAALIDPKTGQRFREPRIDLVTGETVEAQDIDSTNPRYPRFYFLEQLLEKYPQRHKPKGKAS